MTAADRPERPDPPDTDREAVARVFSSDEEACGRQGWVNLYVGKHIADAILTTTDPAARAALIRSLIAVEVRDVLDELVRAGLLTEERRNLCSHCATAEGREHARWCWESRRQKAYAEHRQCMTAWEPVTPSQDAEKEPKQ